MKGLFITLEGVDGSGKSTQIQCLKEYFENRGFDVLVVREPGSTTIGEQVRDILLDINNDKMTPITEAMLYAAARAQLVSEVIKPALLEGKIVIADRFIDSSLAYQGIGRDIGIDNVYKINSYALGDLMPNITFFLDISPLPAMARKVKQHSLDRLELCGLGFQNDLYEGFKYLATIYGDRIKTIDATRSINKINQDLIKYCEELIEDGE